MTAVIPTLQFFDDALSAAALGGQNTLNAAAVDGSTFRLAMDSWCDEADATDRTALERFAESLPPGGTVLDVGCGPGRHAGYLRTLGFRVLGVDTSPVAVSLTRARGVPALRLDGLGPLPGAGGWDGLILLDGNIGIGGHPRRLLAKASGMLAPDGRLLIELDAGAVTDSRWLRLDDGQRQSGPFRWGRLSARHVHAVTHRHGLVVLDEWSVAARHFATIAAPATGIAASLAAHEC